MSTKTLWRSFAGGEITPELFGRFELTKFQTGLRKALNFITLPHGPSVRRPGTRHVLEARDSSKNVRLIPFAFSADQTIVLEFGHQYVRFHALGGTVLEVGLPITGITQASPGVLTYTGTDPANGDWMFLSGIGGMTALNGRYVKVANVNTGANTFQLTDLAGNPVDTSALPAFTAGGTAARVYTLTTPYNGDDLFDIHFAQNSDVLTLVHPSYPAKQLARLGATNWTLTDVSFAPTLSAPTGITATATVAVATNLSPHVYSVTAVAADGVTESLRGTADGDSNNLTLAGNYNTITWNAVVGASRYNVYKLRGGSFAFMGQTTNLSIVDDNVLPDTSKTPPESLITLNTGANDYPSAVTYHEQRRFFGGTNLRPQSILATRNGTESNLTSSVPSQADDGMEFRVAAQQQNRIRHLVPLSDLMALTAGGEWRIFADGEPAITPTSLSVKPMGYSGANNVQPVVTSGSILYVQAQGSRVRELAYGGEAAGGSYRSIDMAIMAPHLFNGFTIKDLAYARAPDQICWAVRNDGTMLGMTYVPEQQVYGWHQHTTAGLFKSVCTVAEGSEDATYVVVERTLSGRTAKFIERMAARMFTEQADAYFVDCGGTYDGAPATAVSGLWHLEGEEVNILADGAVEPVQTVTDGRITLGQAASKVHVGLPFTSDLQTLPLAFEGMQAAGQGMLRNVQAVSLRVTQTSLFKVGTEFNDAKLVPNRSRAVSDPYDSPPSLKTAEVRVQIPGNWSTDGSVCVRQDQPLPCSILAMTLEVATGG
ncbi:hypothetical protein Q5W_15440 [Hydrogenophaga sp. PBC]|uniref:phage protein p13 n=1 Tax=Hydrogenophaga sp. PBC TaxID=795665 RepID=UPI0002606A4F|nr:phage protein p13 [Hydrogenophaga sp. PBC]AOS80263.1 hypothetical protein Q5W_15440 [Hydrogenophaga sp. PBC]